MQVSPSASVASGRYSPLQIKQFADQLLSKGICILPQHFEPATIAAWREALLPLLEQRIQDGTASARGPGRYYISLPFTAPFADPKIYEDPDVLAILNEVTGGDIVMPELACDTPFRGSEYQVVHRDYPQCSPDLPELDPALPFQFGVNFPLCKVTVENGPFEIAEGTHAITDEAAQELIKSGQAERNLKPLLMEVGDIMVRDVRALHRGTPNNTAEPRPMVVVGYNRSGHKRPQLRIYIPREEYATLSERGKQLLRLNPVVDSLSDIPAAEDYSNLYFLEE
jgi:hypothetical protein